MDEIGFWQDSLHFLRSRCSLASIPAAGLTSRCKVRAERYTGAPRARRARPELGRDPDVTPDEHCEEWGGYLQDRAVRRGASPAHHRLSSTPLGGRVDGVMCLLLFNHHSLTPKKRRTAHFPRPAYGEARDGALATAPRGGSGGGAFSPFSVVVAVGPSRGGRSGGHKRQLGWDASQDSRRRLFGLDPGHVGLGPVGHAARPRQLERRRRRPRRPDRVSRQACRR